MQTIVLHHGLLGFNTLHLGRLPIRYWDGVGDAIARSGYRVLVTRVHPTAGVIRRAHQLKSAIVDGLTQVGYPHGKVVIIAHSMGGLDARYAITHLGLAERADALITVSTPHRGSPWYDYLIDAVGVLAHMRSIRERFADIQAFWDVSTRQAAIFNEEVPDAPGVGYYCVTAACEPDRVPLGLGRSYKVISEAQGDNDAMVSVYSARWGMELGHWPFHHLHLVNWPLRPISPPSWEDVRPRYLQLLSLLRADRVLEPPSPELVTA